MLKDFAHQNKVWLYGVKILTVTANDFDGLAGRFKAVGNRIAQLVGKALAFTARSLVTNHHANGKTSAQLVSSLVAGHLVSYGVQGRLIALGFTQIEPS